MLKMFSKIKKLQKFVISLLTNNWGGYNGNENFQREEIITLPENQSVYF